MKLKLQNLDSNNLDEIFGLSKEERVHLVDELERLLNWEYQGSDYASLIEKFWNMFDTLEKKVFAVFQLGRLIGALEIEVDYKMRFLPHDGVMQ